MHLSPAGTPVARILIVEDDIEQRTLMTRWISTRTRSEVVAAGDVASARSLIQQQRFDVVISDIELPDGRGFQVASLVRQHLPNACVLMITAHPNIAYVINALRSKVDDFLEKPLDSRHFIQKVDQLAQQSVEQKSRSSACILAIGAHPDDVELGCGGALLAHREAGHDVNILVVTDGDSGGEPSNRTHEAHASAAFIGADIRIGNLVDTRVPSGRPTIELIEAHVQRLRPDVVYTHSPNDMHQDHRSVHRATLVAAREVPNVLCYQSPSTTVAFNPSMYIDVERYLEEKVKLVQEFHSQAGRAYMTPKVIRATAQYWGRFARYGEVEPFEPIRLTSWQRVAAAMNNMRPPSPHHDERPHLAAI